MAAEGNVTVATVLVVDGCRTRCRTVAMRLQTAGVTVSIAFDFATAQECIATGPPHAAIIGDGVAERLRVELARMLRAARPRARLVFVTAFPNAFRCLQACQADAAFVCTSHDPAALVPYLLGRADALSLVMEPRLQSIRQLAAADAREIAGTVTRAAALLGVSRKTLRSYLG